jgi:hypothetical protein
MSTEAVELVAIESLKAAEVFAEGGAECVIVSIETAARAVETDISTAKGRAEIGKLSRRIRSAKAALDELGKAFVAELKQSAKVVDLERKSIRDRLDALIDEVGKELADYEAKQQARIDEHTAELGKIEANAIFDEVEPSPAAIQDRLDRARSIGGNRDWEEFAKRAETARQKAIDTLTAMLAAAQRREQERADLEALHIEENERQEQARVAAAANAAIQNARREADEKVQRAEQATREANERAADAERVAAADLARVSNEAKAREENVRHRRKTHTSVKLALVKHAGITEELAIAVVKAIAKGSICHVTVNY